MYSEGVSALMNDLNKGTFRSNKKTYVTVWMSLVDFWGDLV